MTQLPTRTVTASALVRQFGLWRDVAAREPIYVQHRGRPRLVLASVELMAALCHSRGADQTTVETRENALLDTIAEPALLVDPTLTVISVGRAARQYFGERAVSGASLGAAIAGDFAPVVLTVANRVLARGIEETVELASSDQPGRRLELRIVPHPAGALLVGCDRAVEDERDRALALATATLTALAALPGHAVASIGLRGYLTGIDPSLVGLTGFAEAALSATRFVTLFDVGSRVAVGDAIERVIETGRVAGCDAALLANHAAPIPARLAFAPQRRGTTTTGVLALISTGIAPDHG